MDRRDFAALTGGNWQVQFDREAMQELISLAPPGIDEIAALSAVSDFLQQGTYTSVIWTRLRQGTC